MNATVARIAFLLVCICIAVLLLTHTISTVTGVACFAIALVIFGIASKGFRKK